MMKRGKKYILALGGLVILGSLMSCGGRGTNHLATNAGGLLPYETVQAAESTQTTHHQTKETWSTIASFETKYNPDLKNRTTNIKVAADIINGITLNPGDTFSFNDTIGFCTTKKGYKKAKIFLDGKEVDGMGGGICQLSSTMYNAALKANIEVVERHAHGKRVYYVEEGKDATIAYPDLDLKLKNTTSTPIQFSTKMENGTLTFSISKKNI